MPKKNRRSLKRPPLRRRLAPTTSSSSALREAPKVTAAIPPEFKEAESRLPLPRVTEAGPLRPGGVGRAVNLYVFKEIKRIGVITAFILIILLVLTFILR